MRRTGSKGSIAQREPCLRWARLNFLLEPAPPGHRVFRLPGHRSREHRCHLCPSPLRQESAAEPRARFTLQGLGFEAAVRSRRVCEIRVLNLEKAESTECFPNLFFVLCHHRHNHKPEVQKRTLSRVLFSSPPRARDPGNGELWAKDLRARRRAGRREGGPAAGGRRTGVGLALPHSLFFF